MRSEDRLLRPLSRRAGRAGMTLIELAMAITILGVAFLMYAGTSISVNRQREATRESSVAAFAARDVLENIRAEPIADVFAIYNPDPADDPDGPGTAVGHRFPVPELRPVPGMPDGMIGEVQLPTMEVAPGVWELREDLVRPDLGMPRDLNGDSIIDSVDHSNDYLQLPVRVRLDWKGRYGLRSLRMDTFLVHYRRGV
ncbi:MAG: prepilin-type N-terminal cleavage/methylation domain-containing protein [Planctomycetota bacterium]